ncbi:hypothetical protein Ct9H90mP29_11320 [bacterium]|nr:MAG: hypothetical protein Ct9H90mP29_11320 [bacterium]
MPNYHGARVFASDLNSNEMVKYSRYGFDAYLSYCERKQVYKVKKVYDSDLWVLSPGVSKDNEIVLKAIEKGIPIVGEIEFC